MRISRKAATGAVTLVSLAAVASGAGVANASQTGTATQVVAQRAGAPCTGWKKAGSVPLKWSKVSDGCGHFGAPGMNMVYSWKVERGSSVCVKVRGFNKKGKPSWSKALCGKSGTFKVHWGNVAANKEIMVKGAALLQWA
ncbi:hypothetical protein [Streptomyces sp. NPDC019507]|uniref:hypothetical protein n=1 Tax=Streptomyces sp. NPDC019507 TaxID=3154689 RepID=UPI003401C5B3